MVSIAKDFNQDMDEYISERRGTKGSFLSQMSKKKKHVHRPVPEMSEEEVYVEYDEPSPFMAWLNSVFGSKPRSADVDVQEDLPPEKVAELTDMESDVEELDDEIEELEEQREGLIQRFLNSMRRARSGRSADEYEEYESDGVPIVDEEVKEVLKLLHVWLEKLPNHELRSFKVSDDFIKYKSMLEKYELIKKP